MKQTAVTATGQKVPKDVQRRKEAEAVCPTKGVDRPLQLLCVAFLVLPHVWVFATQESPSALEQIHGWMAASWAQLTDGKINPDFQFAILLLSIERGCYTWAHSFAGSFKSFCDSRLGKLMGKKPLDVVLTLFWANKIIQLGTFICWYYYIAGVPPSGWAAYWSSFSWGAVPRLQWVLFTQGLIAGQVA